MGISLLNHHWPRHLVISGARRDPSQAASGYETCRNNNNKRNHRTLYGRRNYSWSQRRGSGDEVFTSAVESGGFDEPRFSSSRLSTPRTGLVAPYSTTIAIKKVNGLRGCPVGPSIMGALHVLKKRGMASVLCAWNIVARPAPASAIRGGMPCRAKASFMCTNLCQCHSLYLADTSGALPQRRWPCSKGRVARPGRAYRAATCCFLVARAPMQLC